ncbi:MAG: translation initiation factor IF-2 N-terminal domain-containing protein [Dysosmobacter sp.]
MEKYRVHEVAKDFGLPTKTITEILTKYVAAPKNHMQVLDDHELSVIFDYLTQHNQVSSIQAIFADTYQAKAAPAQADSPADAHKSAAPAENSLPRVRTSTRMPIRRPSRPPTRRRPPLPCSSPLPGFRKRRSWIPARAAT